MEWCMAPGARPIADTTAIRSRSARILALALVVAVYAATRFAAIFTVGANWDEFVLLDRAANTAATGVLEGGGRPGLATLVLVPFAADCRDEIVTLRHARLLWVGITLVFLAGLGVLLGRACGHSNHRTADAWLGVGLLALVPAFLEWSIQIRTDQLALAFGVWGGVALLASRRTVPLAALAGLLFGAGYLATQKAVYVGALAAVLALGQLRIAREFRPAREALRAAAALAAFVLVVAVFQLATATELEVPQEQSALASLTPTVVGMQMSEFDYYRNTIGFRQYLEILPTLGPHLVLLAALLATTIAGVRARRAWSDGLWIAWAVLAVGLAIGAFHASAFAYFWMTLGLFPAVALAVAAASLREALPAGRERLAVLVTAGLWLVLGTQGVARMAELTIDTQEVQRESLAFVHRNFSVADAGFHPEHGPFCRREAEPIRVYFSQVIFRHFAGDTREFLTRRLLDDLRRRPVKFVVQSFRLNQFPVEVRRFLADNYQPYRASVFVAGRRLEGSEGERSDFELIVPGRYRWLPFSGPQPVRIGPRTLSPGEVAEFEAGHHTAEFVQDVPGGMLVLAVNDPPAKAPLAFYKSY
jgi:hypothetical protein